MRRPPAPSLLALAALALAAALPALATAQDEPGPAPEPAALAEEPAASPPSQEEAGKTSPAPAQESTPEEEPRESPPPAENPPPPAPEPPPPPTAPPPAERTQEDNWLDVGHAFFEQRIFAPVLRLDRFFSDERELEAERSRSFLRWRSEVRFEEHTSPHFTTGVRATLRLPGVNKQLRRLQLVIAGQTREAFTTLFPGETAGPVTPSEEEVGAANAELRYRVLESVAAHADLGAGVLFRLPPGAFGRLRLRYVLPVKKLFLTRYVAAGFWRTDTHFGTSAAVEAERPFGTMLVTRIGGGATLTERSKGIEWQSEAVLMASFDPRTAAQLGAQANGATRGEPAFDRFRLYTRLRREFYRRWLFFEMEPGAAWPWSLDRGRAPVWAIALRLEVQFQGVEKPPPPPRDEPKDPPPEPTGASDPLPPPRAAG